MADIKLENFKGFELEFNFDEIAKKHADNLADEINANISKEGWSGDYANSWGVVERGTEGNKAYIVRSTQYQLTHLLENGHIIANKKSGVGWSAPRPHIKPALDYESKAFLNDVENMKIDLKNKGG